MWQEVIAVGCGAAAGLLIAYGYCLYKKHTNSAPTNNTAEDGAFAKRLEEEKRREQQWKGLVDGQSFIEVLQAHDLTDWFREHREEVDKKARMAILTPTPEHLKSIGYPADAGLDEETCILQAFYDEETGAVQKIRLVRFSEIDTNLQMKLIENDGILSITE